MTKQVEETFIYTGPLFLPNEKTNLMKFQVIINICELQTFINFQVLGPKEIFVPTHLFKIVILKISDKDGGNTKAGPPLFSLFP